MRAITLWQPWASLVAVGAKKYETRSWPAPKTLPRGSLLAVHAANANSSPMTDTMFWALDDAKPDAYVGDELNFDLPRGALLAICRFEFCAPAEDFISTVDATEQAFGDWSAGRWVWRLRVLHRFREPIPARGYQGLWNWPDGDVLARELGITEVSR